tara:strand:+ start:1966 stop:3417 length:1452 start_codon:yes stop_codon:yes gene_type:complete
MPDFYLDQEELADGLVIYRNPPKTDSSRIWWYVRIRLKNEKRYVRKSLRTTVHHDAKREAFKLYEQIRKDEYYGFVPNQIKLNDLTRLYLEHKTSLSEARLTQINRIVRLYLSQYYGDRLINNIATDRSLVNGYLVWRQGYWDRYKDKIKTDPVLADRHKRVSKGGYKGLKDNERRTPMNMEPNPSKNTLILEYSIFNALMNFAVQEKYISSFYKADYKSLPADEPRYQAIFTFTKADIKKLRDALVDELRADREPVFDDDLGIQMRDKWGDPTWRTFVSMPHARRCRHNLRALVLLMLSTGMRVQECLDLEYRSITDGSVEDEFGGQFRFLSIRVVEKKSRRRSRGYRTVYAPYHMKKILGRLNEINEPHNKPGDRVFSQVDGSRYGLLMRRFKQLLIKLDIYQSDEGAKHTLTHLRSYYAQEQLQHHPLHIVAAQMGHSVQTLYDFYTQISVGKRAYDILKHIQQPTNIISLATNHLMKPD